jgi:hypothetical protein
MSNFAERIYPMPLTLLELAELRVALAREFKHLPESEQEDRDYEAVPGYPTPTRGRVIRRLQARLEAACVV